MRILFLTKRFYTSTDLIAERYGRLYEIPRHLCSLGHQVELVCHSYRKTEQLGMTGEDGLKLSSWNLGINPLYGFWKHYRRLDRAIGIARPDLIVAASDCYQIITGAALARRHQLPFVADLYDNFLAFKAAQVPGVPGLFDRALQQADAVTVVSGNLKQLVGGRHITDTKLHLLGNAVSDPFLVAQDRKISRQGFGFQEEDLYIGTAGELSREKGIDTLIKAFMELSQQYPGLHLVLAGHKDPSLEIPTHPNIHYLGQLPPDQIPALFTALDVGVVCVRDDEFGRYCFPQKFYEMVATGLPVVASRVGEMLKLLANYPDLLCRPNDAEDMQHAIRNQLQHRYALSLPVPGWAMQAKKFHNIIEQVVAARN